MCRSFRLSATMVGCDLPEKSVPERLPEKSVHLTLVSFSHYTGGRPVFAGTARAEERPGHCH